MKNFRQFCEGLSSDQLDEISNLLENHLRDRIYLTNNKEIPKEVKIKQTNEPKFPAKPKGLWYSSGKEWLNFIKHEYTQKAEDYSKVYSLDIDLSKILVINTPEKFLAFEKEYVWKDAKYGDMIEHVKWEDVSNKYSGIEIIPYFPDFRFNNWYYPWDVASGCIWDFSVIKSYRLLYDSDKKESP